MVADVLQTSPGLCGNGLIASGRKRCKIITREISLLGIISSYSWHIIRNHLVDSDDSYGLQHFPSECSSASCITGAKLQESEIGRSLVAI
jgi:hypothetical protein